MTYLFSADIQSVKIIFRWLRLIVGFSILLFFLNPDSAITQWLGLAFFASVYWGAKYTYLVDKNAEKRQSGDSKLP